MFMLRRVQDGLRERIGVEKRPDGVGDERVS